VANHFSQLAKKSRTNGNAEKIAKANFYYGQLQIINEIKFLI